MEARIHILILLLKIVLILLLDAVSAKYCQNNLDSTSYWMQKIRKVTILSNVNFQISYIRLRINHLQCFDHCFKLSWLHLTVTPSIGIESKHRISVSNAFSNNEFQRTPWKLIYWGGSASMQLSVKNAENFRKYIQNVLYQLALFKL